MPRPSRLELRVPEDFDFPRVVCSYGYFLLAPNRWRPAESALLRGFSMAEPESGHDTYQVRISQPSGKGGRLRVDCDRALDAPNRESLRKAISRMLRIEDDLSRWKRQRPGAWKRGFGRLFRSATLFEDMVKTITSCNVTWPSTVRMNELLVERVGGGAFPSPGQLAAWTPSRLKRSCKVGYRAQRIVRLARRFASGELDPAWFESDSRSNEDLHSALMAIEGFGPFATANVLQLLGRYEQLPIDTETVRLYCKKTGRARPDNDLKLYDEIRRHYERARPNQFLAYWYELWRDYESVAGDAAGWDPDTVGKTFTAAALRAAEGEKSGTRRQRVAS